MSGLEELLRTAIIATKLETTSGRLYQTQWILVDLLRHLVECEKASNTVTFSKREVREPQTVFPVRGEVE